MNKFLTYTGVQPVYLGDIEYMQNAAADIFRQLGGALMDQAPSGLNAVLYGVEISHPAEFQVSWTAGAVIIDGEILPVLAGSLTSSTQRSPVLYFHVVSTPGGTRTFKNGVTRDCYLTRTATLTESSTGGVYERTVKRLHANTQDADYDAAVISSTDVTYCKLLKRGGLFYLDFVAAIEEGQTNFDAQMTFTVTSDRALPIGLVATYVGIAYPDAVVPMYLGVLVRHLTGSQYDIQIVAYNTTEASGSARFTGLLPVY